MFKIVEYGINITFHETDMNIPRPWSYGSWIYSYLYNQCLSPLMLWVRISIRARCTTLCDKVCQWLATGQWFSPGTPVSSTNKTDHHDITEILLKVALNIIKQTNIQYQIMTTYILPTNMMYNIKKMIIWYCIHIMVFNYIHIIRSNLYNKALNTMDIISRLSSFNMHR